MAEWHTLRSQKPMRLTPREGSSPSLATRTLYPERNRMGSPWHKNLIFEVYNVAFEKFDIERFQNSLYHPRGGTLFLRSRESRIFKFLDSVCMIPRVDG